MCVCVCVRVRACVRTCMMATCLAERQTLDSLRVRRLYIYVFSVCQLATYAPFNVPLTVHPRTACAPTRGEQSATSTPSNPFGNAAPRDEAAYEAKKAAERAARAEERKKEQEEKKKNAPERSDVPSGNWRDNATPVAPRGGGRGAGAGGERGGRGGAAAGRGGGDRERTRDGPPRDRAPAEKKAEAKPPVKAPKAEAPKPEPKKPAKVRASRVWRAPILCGWALFAVCVCVCTRHACKAFTCKCGL